MTRRLFIEPPLSAAALEGLVTAEELALAEGFGSPRRRAEFLAWRAVVRRELGSDVQIGYDAAGAPTVSAEGTYIGVSHCEGRIAVAISDTPCAVDIEPEGRSFVRAMPRYMTAAERELSSDPLLPAAVWCAKEALYKFSGRAELDLLRDIHILSADLDAGRLSGRILEGKPVDIAFFRCDGYVVAHIG